MTDDEILEMADNHIKMQFESVRDRELACIRFARELEKRLQERLPK